ncbi:hypothetical protein [Nonomuraea longicatena]|uniref:Lipoprotein n=1 Tax=Nonomuraea longicatena TaxID=83682 RepID=A0ABP4BFE9_9ACTN
MRATELWGAGLLVLALAGCTAKPDPVIIRPPVTPVPVPAVAFDCGQTEVRFRPPPTDLVAGAGFDRVRSFTRQVEVEGVEFTGAAGEIKIGVVCGVKTAEHFVTLVLRARLTAYDGRPALRWRTEPGQRHFMWLARPGTAVYISAASGLSDLIAPLAQGVSVGRATPPPPQP